MKRHSKFNVGEFKLIVQGVSKKELLEFGIPL
jgi:hypothetical protein